MIKLGHFLPTLGTTYDSLLKGSLLAVYCICSVEKLMLLYG